MGKVTKLPAPGVFDVTVAGVRWELTDQYWYLRDLIEKRRSDNLAVEDRETAAAMAVQTMDYFQRKWPGAKVWFMHPPQADEDDYKAKTVGEFCSCRVAICLLSGRGFGGTACEIGGGAGRALRRTGGVVSHLRRRSVKGPMTGQRVLLWYGHETLAGCTVCEEESQDPHDMNAKQERSETEKRQS